MHQKFSALFFAIGAIVILAPSASAQVFQTGYSNGAYNPVVSPVVNPMPSSPANCATCASPAANYQPLATPQYKSGNGCCPTAPTVTPGVPRLPISSCCGQTGPLNIPPITTPLRYDTPPIGRSVGRPIFGRWTGY